MKIGQRSLPFQIKKLEFGATRKHLGTSYCEFDQLHTQFNLCVFEHMWMGSQALCNKGCCYDRSICILLTHLVLLYSSPAAFCNMKTNDPDPSNQNCQQMYE